MSTPQPALVAADEPEKLVIRDDEALAALNSVAMRQGQADRKATDKTNSQDKYRRYYEEYVEYCVLVHEDEKDAVKVTAERLYNFLFYHAYRKKMPKQRKRKRKMPSTLDTVVDSDDKEQHRIKPPGSFPRWFNHDLFSKVMKQQAECPQVPTDLLEKVSYLSYEHLNGIKVGVMNFATPEVKQEIRLHAGIKQLMQMAKSRQPTQRRLQRLEKVSDRLQPIELVKQIHLLEQKFWAKNRDSKNARKVAAALRDRWCFNDSLQCIIRAESLWKEELSDMQHWEHHEHGEPSPYEAMVRVLWEGKTNQMHKGKELLAQCFRHLDPRKCAIGAKALYLFARFRVEPLEIDFTNNDWFDIKTAVPLGDSGNTTRREPNKAMGSGTYEKSLKKFQEETGVLSGKLLHIGRKCGVLIPQLDGVADSQTMQLGNWTQQDGRIFYEHYVAKIPKQAMRSCAGSGADVGRYYLPRGKFVPPEELQKMVWPCIERSAEKFFATEGYQQHTTALRFIESMQYLRRVLLQDAAYVFSNDPERAQHVIYQDPLFQTQEFQDYLEHFAKEYKNATLPQNDPSLKHVEFVVPTIGHAMRRVAGISEQVSGQLSDIGLALKDYADRAHAERISLLGQIRDEFTRAQNTFLRPILEQVNYIATFLRAGAAGAAVAEQEGTLSPMAAAGFVDVASTRTRLEEQFQSPLNPHLPVYAAGVTPNEQSPINNKTTQSQESHIRRGVPGTNEYGNLVGMYRDWIGQVGGWCGYKHLYADPHWRKEHCPRNSGEMKRMQRMAVICSLVDKFIGDCSPQIGDDALVDLVTEIETNVFGDKVPVKFAWTAYEKAFKTYSKSHM